LLVNVPDVVKDLPAIHLTLGAVVTELLSRVSLDEAWAIGVIRIKQPLKNVPVTLGPLLKVVMLS